MNLSQIANYLKAKWQRLRSMPLLTAGIAIAVAAALVIVALLWARSPTYRTLFSNLSSEDGAAIVAQLEQMHVPYQLQANGSSIAIPNDQVDRMRLTLAGQGLPKGGSVGFELIDNQPFGISQFAEHINYERALEGELARSIESLDAVNNARVHLAIPQPSLFIREKRLPSASIILSLRPGRQLDANQVAAISHLVASSVTNMPLNQISIVDQQGNLLTPQDNNSALIDAQLSYSQRFENNLQKRIENLLATTLGAKNVQVVVNAELNFAKIEQTQEMYDPNHDPDRTAIRSRQNSSNEQVGENVIAGVPGALTNQPPVNPLPSNSLPPKNRNQPNNGTNNPPTNTNNPADNTAENPLIPHQQQQAETINYELNRTIRYSQHPEGSIKRLSVAVAVNYQNDKNGKPQPVDSETLTRIKLLAQEAMGFSKDRGDSLEVVNVLFDKNAIEANEQHWWQSFDWTEISTTFIRYLIVALIAWLVWWKLVKPARQSIREYMQKPTITIEPEIEPIEEEPEPVILPNNKEKTERQLQSIRQRARTDPGIIALIIKNWMNTHG